MTIDIFYRNTIGSLSSFGYICKFIILIMVNS